MISEKKDTSVILAAAGSSSRMGGIQKQFALLGGVPVLIRAMQAFEQCESVVEIIVCAAADKLGAIQTLADQYGIKKLAAVVSGGNTRQESVINGLRKISKDTLLVCIHDGARPLVRPDSIEKTLADARVFGGAALGIPVKDTIKVVNDGLIVDTPYRPSLFAMQTPQVFKRKLYFEGVHFARTHGLDFTDDCQLVEAVGGKVYVSRGDYSNIKITTPEDLLLAEALLGGRSCE